MSQYLRYCGLTVEGAGSTMDLSNLRVRFVIKKDLALSPNQAIIKITNLGPEKGRGLMNKEFKKLTLDVGYRDGHGVVFKGNIVQSIYGRENPTDTLATIMAYDGDHGHVYGFVSTTHPPGSTPQDHLNTAMAAFAKYGLSLGYVGVDLSTPVYPRAVTLWGSANDVIRLIGRNKDASVSYQNEKVTIVPHGQAAPGGVIVLNSSTGLVGMPTQTDRGIYARCLINPQIHVHSLVHINQNDVQRAIAPANQFGTNEIGQETMPSVATDGYYVVCQIEMYGDTRGDEWYQDLVMLSCDKNGKPIGYVPKQTNAFLES